MQTVSAFTALSYSSGYFPTAANEPEVKVQASLLGRKSRNHRKWFTSVLKNKVDNFVNFANFIKCIYSSHPIKHSCK